jgi:hypothetical protein
MSPFKATLGFEPTSPTTATFEDNEPSRTLPEQVKILVEMQRFAYDCVKAAQAHMQNAANLAVLYVLYVLYLFYHLMVEMQRFAHDCVKAAQAHMQDAANLAVLYRSKMMQIGTGYHNLLQLATKLSSRRQIFDLYNNHVLNYATATLDRFSLRRNFPGCISA